MYFLDYALQSWRMRVAARWIPEASRVLDIGCHQGEFLTMLGKRIGPSVGMDPILKQDMSLGEHRLLARALDGQESFPAGSFDAVTLLATLEHMQDKDLVARQCRRLLRPGGRLIITVPSLAVDKLLDILVALRLVTGMSLEQHHGFKPQDVPAIFENHGFTRETWRKFQLGLNNLFVFRCP